MNVENSLVISNEMRIFYLKNDKTGRNFMKLKYFVVIIFLVNMLLVNIYGQESVLQDVIKVGVYESKPYYEVDDHGNVSGYYHELLLLLQEKYPFEYEYLICDFSDALKALKEGDIDIMLGISVTPERLKEIIYNEQMIATERFALFSNDKEFNCLSKIKKARVGLVEGSMTVQIALNYFSKIGVDVDPIIVGSWPELEEKLNKGEVDIISHNIGIEGERYHKIYEFSGDQVYIAAHKSDRDILKNMDKAIVELSNQKINPIDALYEAYFNNDDITPSEKRIGLSIVYLFISLILIVSTVPILERKKNRDSIRLNMRNGNYLLQYQPIYNPRNRVIVGFEGLLRLIKEDQKLIPPAQFIPEIEENNMLFEVSLWILERAIKEYAEIRQYDCVKDRTFYISINVSLKEIENKKFVDEASKLLRQSGLGPNKICLEIIEKIKVKKLDKVSENLKRLKQEGFKIAIDDFGTEYSNLDRLLNLDTHIIKIDKCFVEEIDEDLMKNEIVTFVSRIAEVKNKDIVLEGVEQEAEALAIKDMKKDLIYVQGYYYNKPLFKEQIKWI